jgi:hypothetical protein
VKTITLTCKKTAATIFCTNLILYPTKNIVYLKSFGPTQEVRAFAQMFREEPELMIHHDADPDTGNRPFDRVYSVKVFGNLRLIPNLGNGYTGLVIAPETHNLLISATREECFTHFSRILDQEHFVHREWYEKLFSLAKEVPVSVGEGVCLFFPFEKETVRNAIQEMLKWRSLSMPAPTEELTVGTTVKENLEEKEAA